MHYRGEGFGFDVIGPVADFLKYFENIEEGGSVLELEKGSVRRVVVMTPRSIC